MNSASSDSRDAGSEVRKVRVIVALDPDRFDAAVAAARNAGLTVESEMREIGTVVGTVPENALAALAAADGVEEVEQERTYRLPDPGSPMQ
ncbi:hypothetical protein HYE82_31515 [Streptomyces sp. BR123]|uniref:hypothetical protein n=1 Tax=Streptomyces sp. BR123 TaxID=2749828 RepID=UPI0015C4B4DF|nr:hypothetical protein [Streptomyces sp. BR123]NXY98830.1 hypothetical protein [Streptomyces sp. BR123]